MVAERDFVGASVHDAAKLQIADGALVQLLHLHARTHELSAALERSQPWSRRISAAVRQARGSRPRRRAHRAFWRALRDRGSVPAGRADLTALRELSEAGRHDEAIAFAAALLPAKAGDGEFLDLARKAFARAGALSLQLRATTALRQLDGTNTRVLQERRVIGRIRETEPGWLPAVPSGHPLPAPVRGRVVHLVKATMPHRQSGYTMRGRYLVDSQRAAGLDPVVITAPDFTWPGRDGAGYATESINGTPYHHLARPPRSVLHGPVDGYLDAYAAALAERVAELAPSVLHVHSGHRGYEAALVGLAVARSFGLPLVYEVRGFFESLWSQESPWNERGELYARRLETELRCMRAADAVVTLSTSMQAEIVGRGVAREKVHVVPNGVDVSAFTPGPPPPGLAGDLALDGRLVFGYVSNLDHRREGHETLIRAAAVLRSRGLSAVALIVGDGDRRAELERLAEHENAADAVVFTGRVPHDEVLAYYRLLDVFVVPRAAERAARLVTPLKPFEAMAAGVPLVVSALDPLLEIIGDGERGRSFPPGDATALADVLEALHHAPDTRSELAKRGRDWVAAERRWSVNADRYAEIYRSVLNTR